MSNEIPSDILINTESTAAPTRRKMLGTIAAAGALFGLNATSPAAATTKKAPEPLPPSPPPPDALVSMARLRDYRCRRSSSWDRTGGNADFIPLDAGATATLLDVKGAGVITHIWFTINSPDQMHLKNLVLRAWWDGESSPSVEAPIGDFYGLMLGDYFVYQSALLVVAPMRALNAYFQMPFDTAAKITLTNEGKVRTNNLYFAIDYTTVPALPDNVGRFHAQYRQAAPCKKSVNTSGKNLNGADNYVFLEATGRGHFIGVTQASCKTLTDGSARATTCFSSTVKPSPPSTAPAQRTTTTERGISTAMPSRICARARRYIVDPERTGGRYCLYRWHTESFITFEKSIKATIEHGHANDRADDFYSVAYWYQTEPHAEFPRLPPPEARTRHEDQLFVNDHQLL